MHYAHLNERTSELMQQGAQLVLSSENDWRELMQQAISETVDLRNNPAAETIIRRNTIISVTHWANSVLKAPLAPVEPYINPEIKLQIRDQIRQGTPESVLNAYRAAQIVAWRVWMQLAFRLTAKKEELEALLDFSSKQTSNFSERSVQLLASMIEEERTQLAGHSPDLQYATAKAVLKGALRDPQRASHRLGYRLGQTHQAIVAWIPDPDTSGEALDAFWDRVEILLEDKPAMKVKAKLNELWLWIPAPVYPEQLSSALQGDIQVAIGPPRKGLQGFRNSHETALQVQRLMVDAVRQLPLVAYNQIALAKFLKGDAEYEQFTSDFLGDLKRAPYEVWNTLRVYLAEGCNASQTARELGLHRNTLNARLDRANDLLPRPIDRNNLIQIGALLDAMYWS